MRDLFGKTPEDYAISCLQALEPPEGYYLAFSGGKDSVCLYELAQRAGVTFDAHYSQTGIDPPELTRFIKRHYPEVHWEKPKQSFWAGIETNGLPTPVVRWCCRELKEFHGNGRVVLVGVRAAESAARAKRWRQVTYYKSHGISKTMVAPILAWEDQDVWDYIHEHDLPYCSLYDEGWKRIGCIPCPMNSARDLSRYPGMEKALRRAATAYWAKRKAIDNGRGAARYATPEEYWEWWLSGTVPAGDECQLELMFT